MNSFSPRYDEIRFALAAWTEQSANPCSAPATDAESAASLTERTSWPDPADQGIHAVIDEAGRFASEVLAPLDAVGNREGCRLEDGRVRMPTGWHDAYREFVAAGWNTAHFPEALGGQGLPTTVSIAIAEMFNAANIAFCLGLMPFAGVVSLLSRFGTERQKRLYLPELVSGRWTATLAITEPQAGTDLGAIRTRAVQEGESFLIKGQKCFITYGEHDLTDNILHFVLARDPSGVPGPKGLSLYIVPKFDVLDDGSLGPRNDVACVGVEHKIGIHGSPTASMIFGGEEGARGERLGLENRGLEHMFVVLNRARLNIGVFGLASAERSYQAAFAYASERIQGSGPDGKPCAIITHPDVRRMILDMRACIDAMRAIAYYTASLIDRAAEAADDDTRTAFRERLDLLTPITKGWLTETAFQVASTGVQVAGGAGYLNDGPIAQCFCDARVHTIYEGTTGVQAGDLLLRKVLRDNGHAAFALLARMREDALTDLFAAGLDTDHVASVMARALDALSQATQWALVQGVANRRSLEAVAVHYLSLWGNVAGAWLLLKGAAHGSRGSAAPAAFPALAREFSTAKKTGARFFILHRLLPSCALAEVVMNGSGPVLADASNA